jgi:hypothetical protein
VVVVLVLLVELLVLRAHPLKQELAQLLSLVMGVELETQTFQLATLVAVVELAVLVSLLSLESLVMVVQQLAPTQLGLVLP